jgi:hypothetical protein
MNRLKVTETLVPQGILRLPLRSTASPRQPRKTRIHPAEPETVSVYAAVAVEFIWAHRNHHELPNLCAKNFGDLSHHARRA